MVTAQSFILHCLCSSYSWLKHIQSPLSLFRLLIVGTVIYVTIVQATHGQNTFILNGLCSEQSFILCCLCSGLYSWLKHIHSPFSLFRLLIAGTVSYALIIQATHAQNTVILHCLCSGYSWLEQSFMLSSLLRLFMVTAQSFILHCLCSGYSYLEHVCCHLC